MSTVIIPRLISRSCRQLGRHHRHPRSHVNKVRRLPLSCASLILSLSLSRRLPPAAAAAARGKRPRESRYISIHRRARSHRHGQTNASSLAVRSLPLSPLARFFFGEGSSIEGEQRSERTSECGERQLYTLILPPKSDAARVRAPGTIFRKQT